MLEIQCVYHIYYGVAGVLCMLLIVCDKIACCKETTLERQYSVLVVHRVFVSPM